MRRSSILMLLVLAAAALLAVAAMRKTSTTFDELLLPAAGARGYATGKFDLVTDHPPVLQYVYGLPIFLSAPEYPQEGRWSYGRRYVYARAFYFGIGNDPERIAFRARLVGVLIAAALGWLVFLWTRRTLGEGAALLAGGLTAFLPDVVAHSGVSYNDVPLACAYFGAAWAIDSAVRRPSWRSVVLASCAATLALGVKFSALALGPVALVLLAAEGVSRDGDRAWLRNLMRLLPLAVLVSYLTLVLIYLGDFSLASFRQGFGMNIAHANAGHGVPAVLLGRTSYTGFWYFFPVAFLLKTPAALHMLLAVAVLGFAAAWRTRTERGAGLRQQLAASPLRMPLVASSIFLAFTMSANLNIGFRHAIAFLPGLCILVAAGVLHAWRTYGRPVRLLVGGALAAYVLSVATAYPNLLGYLSEYVRGRPDPYSVLIDSSYDWGQGLLALRDFMREHEQDRVFLSYFGSAVPEGYGIDYVTMPSHFPLPRHPLRAGETAPQYLAVSASNMTGTYLLGDPFARLRTTEPDYVLMGNMFIFRVGYVKPPGDGATARGVRP